MKAVTSNHSTPVSEAHQTPIISHPKFLERWQIAAKRWQTPFPNFSGSKCTSSANLTIMLSISCKNIAILT